MVKFAQRLKELRLDNSLTQAELANALSVDQRTVSQWEKGIREPDFETLMKIARYFNVSADYLLWLVNPL